VIICRQPGGRNDENYVFRHGPENPETNANQYLHSRCPMIGLRRFPPTFSRLRSTSAKKTLSSWYVERALLIFTW